MNEFSIACLFAQILFSLRSAECLAGSATNNNNDSAHEINTTVYHLTHKFTHEKSTAFSLRQFFLSISSVVLVVSRRRRRCHRFRRRLSSSSGRTFAYMCEFEMKKWNVHSVYSRAGHENKLHFVLFFWLASKEFQRQKNFFLGCLEKHPKSNFHPNFFLLSNREVQYGISLNFEYIVSMSSEYTTLYVACFLWY